MVKLQPDGAQELVVIINAENRLNGHLERLYWGISLVALDGVIDQVRTALTVMVAEIRANMPDRALIPTAEVATNAVTIAVTGKRNQVNLASSQAGSSVAPATLDEAPRHQWVRVAAGVILGLITIVGVFFALMQAQRWQFG